MTGPSTRVGLPPCLEFDCRLVGRCAAEGLACSAFRHYTATGNTVDPRWLIPDPGEGGFGREMLDEPKPSRAIFMSIYGVSDGG